MSRHSDTTIPLESNTFYHIFNRGNKGIKIFYQERNYSYFLQKYANILSPYLDTYSYNLIPNHFHLIVKVKSTNDVLSSAMNDYSYVSKSLWTLLQRKLETFPSGLFKDALIFLKLLNQPYPKDRYHFRKFIELTPDLLKPNIANWIISDWIFLRLCKSYKCTRKRKWKPFPEKFQKESY